MPELQSRQVDLEPEPHLDKGRGQWADLNESTKLMEPQCLDESTWLQSKNWMSWLRQGYG